MEASVVFLEWRPHAPGRLPTVQGSKARARAPPLAHARAAALRADVEYDTQHVNNDKYRPLSESVYRSARRWVSTAEYPSGTP
jgi:hypothetical protein